MTRMRTVGLFGITLVVIGFALVLFKIRGNRSFWWLLRTQLLAMAGAIAAYSLFPVDYVAHRYNGSRVLNGYLHPSVMIAVKPIDDEGIFPLLSLVDHPEPIIREGVLAKLADRQLQIERFSTERPWHWTRFQGVKLVLYQQLRPHESLWRHYLTSAADREAAILAFQSYAMQWY